MYNLYMYRRWPRWPYDMSDIWIVSQFHWRLRRTDGHMPPRRRRSYHFTNTRNRDIWTALKWLFTKTEVRATLIRWWMLSWICMSVQVLRPAGYWRALSTISQLYWKSSAWSCYSSWWYWKLLPNISMHLPSHSRMWSLSWRSGIRPDHWSLAIMTSPLISVQMKYLLPLEIILMTVVVLLLIVTNHVSIFSASVTDQNISIAIPTNQEIPPTNMAIIIMMQITLMMIIITIQARDHWKAPFT